MGVISAVRQNNVARIRAFISAGAINNMNPINEAALINACKFGNTVLDYADNSANKEIINLLKQAGVK